MTVPAFPSTQRLAHAATLIAVATVASRFLGLLREIVAAWLFGATDAKAAYVIAYYIPFFVQRLLLGGTLSIVFIPTISKYLVRNDRAEARRVSGNLFTLVVLVGLAMVGAGQLLAPLLVPLAAPGFAASPDLVILAVRLMRIIFVSMLFLALSVFVTGFLQAHHQFAVPAMAPLVFNAVIIGGTLTLGIRMGIQGLAISWILGTAAQFLVQMPAARQHGLRFLPVDLQHPAVKELGKLAVPAILGLAVVEINAYVARFFASLVPTEAGANAVAVLDYAYEVVQAPAGIFAISIATAVFPLLARYAAADAGDDLRATVALALRTTIFIILPVAALAIALREPLIGLLFERGQFGKVATEGVASALAAYAIGLPAIGAYYIVTRAYYALQDMRTPVRIGAVMVVINAVLDYALLRLLGTVGIALATSLVATLNVGTLIWFLRRRLQWVGGTGIARMIVRIGAAAAAAGGVMSAVAQAVGAAIGPPHLIAQIVQVGAAAGVGAVTYLVICRLLGVEELGVARALLRRRPVPADAR